MLRYRQRMSSVSSVPPSPASNPTPSLTDFAALIRLSNQTGTLLLMLPSLWALVLASNGRPSVPLMIIFVVGSFVMRSAGVIINDLADRSFDRQVTRTKMRPLAVARFVPFTPSFSLSDFCLSPRDFWRFSIR